MIVFSDQTLLAFSLHDLCCIILTIRKQIIAFKKGTFASPAPPTERQEGCLLPLSGVPGYYYSIVDADSITTNYKPGFTVSISNSLYSTCFNFADKRL